MNYSSTRFNENLNIKKYPGVGLYDIPAIKPEKFEQVEFIPFNFCKTCPNPERKGVHFFVHDYQFERLWRNLRKYVPLLSRFRACMTPDYSMYTDWPVAVQIWNHYKKHYIGACLQENGVKVYPTISWSDEASYKWCFDGEPINATVCISSVGTQKNEESKRLFIRGYDAMIEHLRPVTVIFYGTVPRECKGNIVRITAFQEKFKEAKISGY